MDAVLPLENHFEKLEQMYRSASIHKLFPPFEFKLEKGFCEIKTTVNENYHHAAGAMHGSFYFRLLDDVGFFAAQSREKEYFLLTKSLELKLLRPVQRGALIAEGELLDFKNDEYSASARLSHAGKLVAIASLKLVKSKMRLSKELGYE